MISVTDFLCVSFEPIRGNVCIKVGVKFSKIRFGQTCTSLWERQYYKCSELLICDFESL